jgi:hypothetical protein
MAEELSSEVARFLDEHVASVGQLEVLLLLRERAGVSVTAADVAREVGIDPEFAGADLRELAAHGLLAECPGSSVGFRFAPASPALGAAVAAVAAAYAQRRVSIINRIVNKPSPTIRAFADAFRLRKE